MSLIASIGSYDNLDDPKPFFNHSESIYGITITCLILTTICTSLRLYVRFFVTCRPGIDDIFIILLSLSTWVASIGSMLMVHDGLGEHYLTLYMKGRNQAFSKTFWWANAMYNMALMFVKLSLLTQYLRLFREHAYLAQMAMRRRLTMALTVAVALWGIAYSFLAWVPCVPVRGFWHSELDAVRYAYGSHDIGPFVGTFVSHATLNMAFDIAVLSIPISTWRIWSSEEGGKVRRRALIVLYALGAIVLTCSVIRFIVIVLNRAATLPEFDPSWYGATSIGLSIIEIHVATILAALPVFWPHLTERLNSIMITREVEINVSGIGFNEIKDDEGGNERGDQEAGHIWSGNHRRNIYNDATVVALHDLGSNKEKDRNNKKKPSMGSGQLRDQKSSTTIRTQVEETTHDEGSGTENQTKPVLHLSLS